MTKEGFAQVLEKRIIRINYILIKLLKCSLCILFLILIFIVMLNVICRYVLKNPLFWVTELSCYILVYLIFGGAALALYKGEHVVINIERARIPIKMKYAMKRITILSNYFFILLLIIFGVLVTIKNWGSYTGTLSIPMGYVYAAAPINGVIMLFLYTERVLEKQ